MSDPNWALSRKRQRLTERAQIIQSIRSFFIDRGYLEVETPHRIPANAPEPHIDAVASGACALHTSPELAMKRMLAAGYEQLFQICRVWRNGERGQFHLPEFTLLEWYRVGIDYNALMNECMELLFVLLPGGKLDRGGRTIDLTMPWQKLTVTEAFTRYASMDLNQALASDCFEEILTSEVEPHLGKEKPTFLTEYPSSLAALARSKPGEPQVAERFELYIDGLELANAFSELTDAEEQRRRFEKDEELRRTAGKTPYPLPEKFLAELENIPEAAGIALGLDRLIMLITEAEKIDDVVAFGPDDL
ncbi:EF-P lysine aminoacylase EpmA [Deltaproteobacteria bacterium IMCC39524]|nr:EF-P lysine aminoacylase EpmA [Deltaproteobacteria bacterium IMCC39524]